MKDLKRGSIYSRLAAGRKDEVFQVLAQCRNVRIERIISRGQKTPEGAWLKQARHEWVLVLRGGGKLSFKGRRATVLLKEGDYIFIPAHTEHRVEWTHPRKKTVWLAVHIS